MSKIIVTQPMNFSKAQKVRLEALGEIQYYDEVAATPAEWLKRCQDAEIICSGITGLRDAYGELKNTFISVPFVGVSSFADPAILQAKNITLCNSPGCNKRAVSEWIIFMMIELMRELSHYINTTEIPQTAWPVSTTGLADRKITILGKGNIGTCVGDIATALGMEVTYFTRGDNLAETVKDADVVVDALSTNPSTLNLLNAEFFAALRPEAIFISVTVDSIVDITAMLTAVENGKLRAVAHDVMNAKPGDITDVLYKKLQQHSNVYATPHISGFSDVSSRVGSDMMIDNVEAWLAGKPINIFGR